MNMKLNCEIHANTSKDFKDTIVSRYFFTQPINFLGITSSTESAISLELTRNFCKLIKAHGQTLTPSLCSPISYKDHHIRDTSSTSPNSNIVDITKRLEQKVKNAAAINLLKLWLEEKSSEQEETDSLKKTIEALDRDRISSRRLFH